MYWVMKKVIVVSATVAGQVERRVAVPTNKEERVSDVPMDKSGQVTE